MEYQSAENNNCEEKGSVKAFNDKEFRSVDPQISIGKAED